MSEYDELVEGFDGLDADEKELLAGQIKASAHLAAPEHGAPSSLGERPVDNGEAPGSTPGGLIEEVARNDSEPDEPPFDPMDWPEEEIASHGMTVGDQSTADALDEILGVPVVVEPEMDEDTLVLTDLRPLKPDQRPKVGVHFVIYGGVPMPVRRDQFGATEDEFVRSQIDESDTLKDPDGQRRVRADRALRQRYRGYVCGEMSSL